LAFASQALVLRRLPPRSRHPAGGQSAFNALMILRFVRDDGMTLRAQKDQTEFRARQKTLRDFVVSFLSHRSGKTTDRFETAIRQQSV
jgi:hypothetical protein